MPPRRLDTFMHANSRMIGNRSTRRRNQRGNPNATDLFLLQNEIETGALSTIQFDDVAVRPVNGMISQRPPRNLANQIYWWKSSVSSTANISISGAPNEINYGFTLASIPGYASLVTVFDQYCIYSVIASFNLASSTSTTNSIGSVAVHTAIDFDSTNNLGTIFVMESYTTHHVTTLTDAGTSVVRYLKPCTAPVALNSSSSAPALVSRNWLDCAYTGVIHYGLRSMYELFGVTPVIINVQFTFVVGFRNAI